MVSQQSSDWQEGFLKVLPAVQQHARIRFRRLAVDRREEAIQEAIAAACVNYQLAAAQGKLTVVNRSSLADFAVKHVWNGRHVGGKQNTVRDVTSPACQRRYGFIVHSTDMRCSDRDDNDWQQLVIADRKVPVPDLAAFRLDFGAWILTHSRRDRSIISALIAGERPCEVANRLGISPGRVSQLRCRYEEEWLGFQGEDGSARAA